MRTQEEVTRTVEAYGDLVRRLCVLHLKNRQDTEDVFQTVFLKYLLYTGSFESEQHKRAWLVRVTVNACKDLLRSFLRKPTVPLELAEELAGSSDENREVLQAVLSLPPKYKDAVYLFYYEGYSAVEIAQILHKKENTIYTWLARGRELLRQQLGGEWE